MKELSIPDYTDLETLLDQTSLKLHASEAHGLMVGLLCGNTQGQMAWREIITGDKVAPSDNDALQALYDASAQQLREFLFDLQLFLPSDEQTLPLRAEALTVWTQGFLTGLKLAQVPLIDREASDLTESINDLIEIAKMNYEEVVANEEDETAYVELLEYVRMAVIYIYQELQHPNVSQKARSLQ